MAAAVGVIVGVVGVGAVGREWIVVAGGVVGVRVGMVVVEGVLVMVVVEVVGGVVVVEGQGGREGDRNYGLCFYVRSVVCAGMVL